MSVAIVHIYATYAIWPNNATLLFSTPHFPKLLQLWPHQLKANCHNLHSSADATATPSSLLQIIQNTVPVAQPAASKHRRQHLTTAECLTDQWVWFPAVSRRHFHQNSVHCGDNNHIGKSINHDIPATIRRLWSKLGMMTRIIIGPWNVQVSIWIVVGISWFTDFPIW